MADVSTEVAIATQTLGSAASSITFSSIAASWTDLRLVLIGTTSTDAVVRLRYNSDTGTNYSNTFLYGDGANAASSRSATQAFINLSFGADFRTLIGMITADIFSYAGSTYKTLLSTEALDLNGAGTINQAVSLWRSTSAITNIQLSLSGTANFATGTTATLYGIL